MPVFLILMVLGMVGLALMAVPGLNRHGHSGGTGIHTSAHLSTHSGPHAGAHVAHHAAGLKAQSRAAAGNSTGLLKWIPSPRAVFSMMTLTGAFGHAFATAGHFTTAVAFVAALVPAFVIERFLVSPAWNSLMKFEGLPSSPLEELTLQDAEAVTPFRNGKGIVTVERDGRAVQFRATLVAEQIGMPVAVGDKLKIEQVDSEHERLTVTLT